MNDTILFKEKQQFRQWWLWLILSFVAGDAIWGTIKTLRSDTSYSFEHSVLPFLMLLVPAAVLAFMRWARLETEIRTDGIYVRFVPFHKRFRFYPWHEIERAYVRKYSPISEYGGWGLRGLGSNRALNISGYEGLQLVTKNGDRLLIGTRNSSGIEAALRMIPNLNTASHK